MYFNTKIVLPYIIYLLLFFQNNHSPNSRLTNLKVGVNFDAGKGNFSLGEKVKVSYNVTNQQTYPITINALASLADLDRNILKTVQKDITIPALQTVNIDLEVLPNVAGALYVYLRLNQGKITLKSKHNFVGYALDQLDRPDTSPNDLQVFWESAKKELNKIPKQFKLTQRPSPKHGLYEVYDLEYLSANNLTIKGIFRTPNKKTKVPVVIQIPSLGGAWIDAPSLGENASRGVPTDFAVLMLNIRNHGKSDKIVNVTQVTQLVASGANDKDAYFYKGAVLDCIRAVDFLVQRNELDISKIVVEGASQGGGLSLLLAALDKRVSLCAPDVPFLCDMERLASGDFWVEKELKLFVAQNPTCTMWQGKQTMRYFDNKNLSKYIECPVLMSVGLQDWTCPAHVCYASFNHITSPKTVMLYPNGAHEGGGKDHRKLKYDWIRTQFGMGN